MVKMKIKMVIKILVLGSILSLLSTSCLLSYVLYSQKHFYRVGSMDFTFWRTTNGTYITPYRYKGLTFPKNDYMIASNLGGVIIYIGEDSTLYIFPSVTYEQGAKTIEINLTSYKYEYFPYINEIDAKRAANDKMIYYKSLGYPFIDIEFRDMYVRIGNSVVERNSGTQN